MSNTMLVLVLIGLLFIIIAAVAIVIVLAFKTKRKKKPSQVAKENDELKKNSKKGNVKLQEMDVINYMDDSLKSTRRFCSPDGVNPRPLEYLEINDGGRPIYVCTMFTHSLPHTSTFATTYAPLMNMPDCITNVYIEPLTQAKSEKMADKQVIALDSEARAASKNYDVNRSRKMSTRVAKVEEWARVIESGLNNFYRVAFSFTLRATTVKGLYDAAAKLYSVAIEKNIELSAAYATHLEAYMSAAPLNAILKIGFGPLKDKIVSYDILDKNSLGDIFNHTEAFFSHKNGILWGRNSLTGQPVLIDPYDKSHSNYNFCISGISGVGKSASVKMMMSRLIEMEGYRFAIIDFDSPNGSEGEYVPLVRMEGGVVYQLAHNTENILNPFDIDVESDYEPKLRREVIKLNVMEKISDCTDLLLTMIKDGKNIEDFADDVHLSKLIRETISELYDELEIKEGYPDSLYVEGTDLVDGKLVSGKVKKKMPSIHRAYIKILYKKKYNKGLYPEKTLDVALAGLSRYVRELYYSEDSIGVYTREAYEAMQKDENGFKFVEIKGKRERVLVVRGTRPYFDGQSTISVNQNTQSLDIDISQLPDPDRPVAQMVAANIINEYFVKKNSNNPNKLQKCVFLIDECHRAFPYEDSRKLLSSLYRQVRKRYVAMGSVTQALADYSLYEETKTIVKNSGMKIMFKQSRMDRDYVKAATPLTEAQLDEVMRLGGATDANGAIDGSRKGECVLIDNDDTVVFLKTDYLQSETAIVETDPAKLAQMYGGRASA